MNPDEEDLNTSQNILGTKELKIYQQSISRPNTDLWYAAMDAEMDSHWHYHI
jgi:hypothetical protein